MIWDYTYNRPLELSYPTEHDSESFRKEVDEWMDNNCLLDDVSKKSIKSSLIWASSIILYECEVIYSFRL